MAVKPRPPIIIAIGALVASLVGCDAFVGGLTCLGVALAYIGHIRRGIKLAFCRGFSKGTLLMALIPPDEYERLAKAIAEHAFLHRVLRQIEHLHRVVFHAESLEWNYVRAAAEEILIADLITRHQGSIDGVYYALRQIEDKGQDWMGAVNEYASYVHNYYTMPLGVVMRRDLFGKAAHFVTPAAGPDSPLSDADR